MKLDKNILKQLVREAIEDPAMAGTRMDSREAYSDEESYGEIEGEEDEVVMELESIITSLMAVKSKLEGAQEKEGLKEGAEPMAELKFYRDSPRDLAEIISGGDSAALIEACDRAFMHTYGVTADNYLNDSSMGDEE